MMLVKSYVTSLLLIAFFVHGAESFVNNRASGNSCIASTNHEKYDLLSKSIISKLHGPTLSFSRGTKISEMKMVRSRGLEIREESATPLRKLFFNHNMKEEEHLHSVRDSKISYNLYSLNEFFYTCPKSLFEHTLKRVE